MSLPASSTPINVTELDFDQIKDNLKAYFKRQESPFRDWDFDGSGLNMLLDVLAYNTHYNAVLAHLTLNESFLDTAQVRSNVVSQAKLLGYLPRSIRSASAKLNVIFPANPASIQSVMTLPRGTTFSSTVGDNSYPFVTTTDVTAVKNVSGQYAFTTGLLGPSVVPAGSTSSSTTLVDASAPFSTTANLFAGRNLVILSGTGSGAVIPIVSSSSTTLTFLAQNFVPDSTTRYIIVDPAASSLSLPVAQGTLTTLSYTADNSIPSQKFVIADDSADISTLLVRVRDYANSTSYRAFTPFSSLATTDGSSQVYFISENTLGQYEITFGDGVFGKALANLNVVELEYVATSGTAGNGASSFTFTGTVPYDSSSSSIPTANSTPLSITPLSASATGGADRESIDSIRFNAPNSLITQNRAVTASDYKAIILKEFGSVDAITCWGGEDEVKYDPLNAGLYAGQAYISIKPSGASTLTAAQKSLITSILSGKRVMTINPNFVDPDYTYLYLDVLYKYAAAQTTYTPAQLNSLIGTTISSFNQANLLRFDGVFRYSNFLRALDSTDPAILNSFARVFFYKYFTLQSNGATAAQYNSAGINAASWKKSGFLTFTFGQPLYGTDTQPAPMISSDPFIIQGTTYYLKDGPQSTANIAAGITARKLYMSTNKTAQADSTTTPGDGAGTGTNYYIGTLYQATGSVELFLAVSSSIASVTLSGSTTTGAVLNAVASSLTPGSTTSSFIVTSGTGTGTVSGISTTSGSFGSGLNMTFPAIPLVLDTTSTVQVFCSVAFITYPSLSPLKLYAVPKSDDVAPKRNQLLTIDIASTSIYGEADTIAASGSAGAPSYATFTKDR